jgi:hypothetical protein
MYVDRMDKLSTAEIPVNSPVIRLLLVSDDLY